MKLSVFLYFFCFCSFIHSQTIINIPKPKIKSQKLIVLPSNEIVLPTLIAESEMLEEVIEQINYAQEAEASLIEAEPTDLEKGELMILEKLRELDSLRVKKAFFDFKSEMLKHMYSFRSLYDYTSQNFLDQYKEDGLEATAFNPILNQIRRHIDNITFGIKKLNISYGSYYFVSQSNYVTATVSFEAFKSQWRTNVTKSCSSSRKCTDNKRHLSNMNPLIEKCITNLETLLKL